MKKPIQIDPTAAFPNQAARPGEDDLARALGPTHEAFAQIQRAARADAPAATWDWRYSARSGWYGMLMLKKRRLFYLIPRAGDFRLAIILGGKAQDALRHGPQAPAVEALLPQAKRYPEGIAFEFSGQSAPALVSAFVAAKMAH